MIKLFGNNTFIVGDTVINLNNCKFISASAEPFAINIKISVDGVLQDILVGFDNVEDTIPIVIEISKELVPLFQEELKCKI